MNDIVSPICSNAQQAAHVLAKLNGADKNRALHCVSEALLKHKENILIKNSIDIENARHAGLSTAMIDRLTITEKRFDGMLQTIREVIALHDPVGEYTEVRKRADGLLIGKMRAPIGVVFIIFESRPNVTVEAFALCLKSGNAVILRGGSEAIHSNTAIGTAIQAGLKKAGITEHAAVLVENTDRSLVDLYLKQSQTIDVVIARGGQSLIEHVRSVSTIPVIAHDKGMCHLYIEKDYDVHDAVKIAVNAKVSRPGVCNAIETLLVHKDFPGTKELFASLLSHGVELRGCSRSQELHPSVKKAEASDWDEEYLDLILAVRIVDSFDQAVSHINRHGSRHTEAILTNDLRLSERFKAEVDAGVIIVNASTRLSDGGEFGLGGEIGISNQKLHVRGPMGLTDLTTLKYVVTGQAHIRE